MATYKVIQDIEAEDKLLGPLTLRQFIYAAIAVVCFYLSFLVITKHAGYLALVFLPFGAASGFFAWPWSRDQPTEIWALAKIRFMLKPRKRIWDQSGAKELVNVTAPKKIEAVYTNGLSQNEVQSRLKALADMIDSRGWATKKVALNMVSGLQVGTPTSSDRLIDVNSLPMAVEDNLDIGSDDDILEANNPVARQFDSMIAKSTQVHRAEVLAHMQAAGMAATEATPAAAPIGTMPTNQLQANGNPQTAMPTVPANNYWFLNQPSVTPSVPQSAAVFGQQVVEPTAPIVPQQPQAIAVPAQQPAYYTDAPEAITPEQEQALINQLRAEEIKQSKINPFGHYHTVQPLSAQQLQANAQQPSGTPYSYSNIAAPGAPMSTGQVFGGQPTAAIPNEPWNPDYVQTNPAQSNSSAPSNAGAPQQVTAPPDPAILRLATNDDLDVATIAREANKRKESQDEVVISLH